MFGKINKKTVSRAMNNAKDFLSSAYKQTKNFAGDVDFGIRTAKSIYSAVSPLLQNAMGAEFAHLNKNIVKGIDNYENIRHRVMATDQTAKEHFNNVVSNLKASNIDIGL
tara:strand:+ start:1036 stop:1365 length:330 start_codon:yes stop_codon:yes gene_type:complete